MRVTYNAKAHKDVRGPCHPALSLSWLPTPLCSRAQSCRQYLFPTLTCSRLVQQSITVFWVSFSLCFLKIHYTQPEVWIVTEYQVSIFMEVLILTPRHSSSAAAAARSAPGIAYGCKDCFCSRQVSLSLQQGWISSAALPGSHSPHDVLCSSLHLTYSHLPGQARGTRDLWHGVLSLLHTKTLGSADPTEIDTEKTYTISSNL